VTKKESTVGRPTKFKEEYITQAFEACKRLGAIDEDLAAFFGCTVKTLNNWKHVSSDFLQSIKKGKEIYDTNEVEKSLRDRAVGYSHDEDKIFCNKDGVVTKVGTTKHYPPETAAMVFWLKNRDADRWKDRQEVHTTLDLENATREELEAELAQLKGED